MIFPMFCVDIVVVVIIIIIITLVTGIFSLALLLLNER
jgi:hypothetical protein